MTHPWGAGVPTHRWVDCFRRLGEPLSAEDEICIQAYAAALAYPEQGAIALVETWQQAERILRDPAWDHGWWKREQQERERLMVRADVELGAEAQQGAGATVLALADDLQRAATHAATRQGVTDEALVRVASGAAAMALHDALLAQSCGCDGSHMFMRKCALFEAGRWPLGWLRGVLHIF